MAEKRNYKKSTSKPGEIDTKLGALVSNQLRSVYEQEFKESWENIRKVNVKKFALQFSDILLMHGKNSSKR